MASYALRGYVPSDDVALDSLARAVHAEFPPCPLHQHREWSIAIHAPAQHMNSARAYVAHEENGRIVGYGSLWPTHSLNAIRMHILVAPERQMQGIGSGIYDCLLSDLNELNAPYVQARIRDAQTQALAFAAHRGFVTTQQMVNLRLRVTDVDIDAFAPLFARLAEREIVLTTLAEEQKREPACWEKLGDLFNAVHPDTPEGQLSPAPPVPLEQLIERLKSEADLPDANIIARSGDRYIGWSPLTMRDVEAGTISVGALTGVRREYRRLGVATALKALTIRYAQRNGFQEIATKTANPAMLSLSEKLGFRRESAEARLIKQLSTPRSQRDELNRKPEADRQNS